MRCPNCGLENPPTGLWCDCGFDFATGAVRVAGPRPRSGRVLRGCRRATAAAVCAALAALCAAQTVEISRIHSRLSIWDIVRTEFVTNTVIVAAVVIGLVWVLLYDLRMRVSIPIAMAAGLVAFIDYVQLEYTLVIAAGAAWGSI